MGRFYGIKILNEEINSKTGIRWSLEDVPRLWKTYVEIWLQTNLQ